MTPRERSPNPLHDSLDARGGMPPQAAPVERAAGGAVSGAVRAQDCTDCIFSNCQYPSRTACRMWCPEIC